MQRLVVTLPFILLPSTAYSVVEKADKAAPNIAASPVGMETLFSTAGGLLFILLLIFGLAWAFKRYTHLPKGSGQSVKVVGGVSLGPRERVVVVEIDNTRLVLGVAPGRVQTLHILPEKKGEEAFAQQLDQQLKGEQK
jgi:flagellar protein FliO/FliZ